MPRYDYRCSCDNLFEVHQTLKDRRRKGFQCPACGGKQTQRIISKIMLGAIVGAGDTTSIIPTADGSDFRLKERTQKDQKKEIQRELEKREQQEISKGEVDPRFRLKFEVS